VARNCSVGGTSFSAPGDSGSLVYTIESRVIVPLEIHVGAPESIAGHSAFSTYLVKSDKIQQRRSCNKLVGDP